jgi:hypothetical protein
MIASDSYKQFLSESYSDSLEAISVLGHARLVTNGFHSIDKNNQPIVRDGIVVIHNGIVVNSEKLWADLALEPNSDVDSEVIPAIFSRSLSENGNVSSALKHLFSVSEGEVTFALSFAQSNKTLLASNTGSLYVVLTKNNEIQAFVSEQWQAEQFISSLAQNNDDAIVKQVTPGTAFLVDNATLQYEELDYKRDIHAVGILPRLAFTKKIEDKFLSSESARKNLLRCSKCLLPETMPYILYDVKGVCNYCHNHRPITYAGEELFEKKLDGYRRTSGNDCFVALSGGRDSCYALHLLTKKFGMKTVAYTYDWGIITPLARRNQARMCGELGVEHIWVSADIAAKRRNIKKNLEAWLAKPALGMLPLLMAGDKQFFYYANKVSKNMGIDLMVLSTSKLERTDFKSGFANTPPVFSAGEHYHIGLKDKLSIARYYAQQYITNYRYINRSLVDTAFAFGSYYFTEQEYVYPFNYIPWNEEQIESTLLNDYGWELATDTPRSWRIGDGTAAFYNYVYHTIAGFSEFDTFRSNQIREGIISREEGLMLLEVDNIPRWESIREYLQLINVDFDYAIKTIDMMPKMYE